MLYLVCYELKRPNQDYDSLYAAIEGIGNNIHATTSHWFVQTSLSAAQIYGRLKPHIDDNDYIFVTSVGHDRQGWLPQKVWDWIDSHS